MGGADVGGYDGGEGLMEHVARGLRGAMAAQGWSQSRLAEASGVPQETISRWCRADCGDVGFAALVAVCRAMRMSLDGLLGEKGPGEGIGVIRQLSPSARAEVVAYATWRLRQEEAQYLSSRLAREPGHRRGPGTRGLR